MVMVMVSIINSPFKWYYSAHCEQSLSLAIRAILESEGNLQKVQFGFQSACTLLLLLGMAPVMSGKVPTLCIAVSQEVRKKLNQNPIASI